MSGATVEAEPAWLADRRAAAGKRALELGLPQFKGRPGWEFTDLTGLELDAYSPANGGGTAAAERVEEIFTGLSDAIRLTQVDGKTVLVEGELPEGVIVAPLAEAAARHPDLVEKRLGSVVAPDDVFAARNEAGFSGGAFVHVPEGVSVEAPIVLTVTQEAERSALAWRTLVVLETGARAEVWEQALSASPDLDALFNTTVELVVGDDAHLRYVSGQQLSERSWILGSHRAEVGAQGSLDWVALGFGSGHGRVRMETKLAGPGADAKVTGAYAGHRRQHLDFDTTQEHAAHHTTSDLAFRGVLSDRSTSVWRGMIRVDPGAQQTDAFQESRNLLLSKRAHADAIPGLEIEADDVRCTHAAAIAQIDAEQLFYLRSRGLREPQAKRLVIEGFLAALVERFEEGPVRGVLADALERRLALVLGD